MPADPRWEAARPEAEAFLAWLQDRYLAEKDQLPKYNESQLEGSSRPAECRPEKPSTRTLDESLGWNEEAFKAFVKALAGKIQNLNDLVHVYRKYHTRYYELLDRIGRTDYLIDQVVYRLYGLTEEEIAIVEREA